MPKSRRLALLGLAIAVCGVPSQANTQAVPGATAPDPFQGLPNVSIEYYDVVGTDEASINASLDQNSPTRYDGTKASASTRYTMPFQPYQVGTGASCKVTKVRADPGAVVRLPRLVNERAVPERIMVKWRPFMIGLRIHEAGHIRIEYAHIAEVVAAMIGSRCDQTGVRFHAAMARVRVLQDSYDRDTDSGATQGAVLQ